MSGSTYGSKSTPFQLRVIQQVFKIGGNIAPGLAGKLALELFSTPIKRTLPDFSGAVQSEPERIQVPYEGGFLHAYAWGEGPTVMMVHGWESNSSRFKQFVNPLVERGFRVVLVDGHAHGNSTGKKTNYILYAQALYAVVQHIGTPYTIVAHSFGTGAAMNFLNLYPDVQPERIVLVAPVDKLRDGMRMFADRVHLPARAFDAFERTVVKRVGKPVDDFDVSAIAANRHEAALIIHDRDDKVVPYSNGESVAAAWNGAEFVTTEGLGHRRILKDEAVIERIVGFVAASETETAIAV